MSPSYTLVSLMLTTVLQRHSTEGAKVLLIPEDHAGHVNLILAAGQTLVQEGGHVVYVLTSDRHQKIIDGFNITSAILTETVKGFQANYDELLTSIFRGGLSETRKAFSIMSKVFLDQCKATLEDDNTMRKLHQLEFDLVLIDGFVPSRCMYIIPYKLGVKYVTFNTGADPWPVRVPAMPSAEPQMPIKYFQPTDVSFLDRLENLMAYVSFSFALLPVKATDDLIDIYAPEMPKTTFRELFLQSEMWLISQDNVCLNTPMISAPHYQYVAGINTRPAKPLPAELEGFANSAKGGMILFTFGSWVKRMPRDILDKFMGAFRQIQYRVLMRFDGDIENVPANVKISKWLPQNDILGHPNTKLFITHAGNCGQNEAIYHGVPMLCVPLFSDQKFNAKRAEHRGFGKTIDVLNFEVDELVSMIRHLMDNSTYRENIQRCSKIYHDFPSAQQTIKFYVDHVLKFGGSHLKPAHLKMPLWKFFMLDVMLFLLVATTISTVLMMVCCRSVYMKYVKKPKLKDD